MANLEHIERLKRGVEQWNEWRRQHQDVWLDLHEADLRYRELYKAEMSGADLSEANLRGSSLNYANLKNTNLRNSDLFGVYLNNANLSGADLSGADLNRAELYNTDLSGANLSGTDLNYATFWNANLSGANLSGAKLLATAFAKMDLRKVKGLTELDHKGGSLIELQTVQLPQDGSALHFLRGAGILEEWIDFYHAQMMHPIQYHSLFISYSSKDTILAQRLHTDFQDQGVRCWFAPHDMKIGNKIRDRIDEAIHLQDKLLLLLSAHAIASVWVEAEVEAALEKENRQQREVLFPVRLDDSVMQTSKAWAATLRRTRHIGDFTNWTDPQAYQIAFDRLLHDLKQN